MSKPAWTPEVLIVYAPGDGQLHIAPAHRVNGEWKFATWQFVPEAHEADFLAEAPSEGFKVFDVREGANEHTPGMGQATPIIIYRPLLVTLQDAFQAGVALHKAILAS